MVYFKSNEKILCIQSDYSGVLKAGNVYTVLMVRRFPDGVILKEVDGEWFPKRFKKIDIERT